MIIDKIKQLNRKAAVVGVAGVLVLTGGTALALTNNEPTQATEEPPIVTQVNEHEERIDGLETKTEELDMRVTQNTADIKVIQQETGVQGATTSEEPTQPSAQPVQEPQPTPEPEPVDPYTIVKLEVIDRGDRPKKCIYTFENGMTNSVYHGTSECFAVGTIIPYTYRPR